MKLRQKIIIIFFVIFLFCAIFTPDFFPFSMRYLVVIICGLGLAWYWIRKRRVVLDKKFKSVFVGFVPFIVWLILAQFIHLSVDRANTDIYLFTLEHTLEVFLAGFLIGMFVIYFTSNNRINFRGFLKILVVVASIQLSCVVMALVFPGIRTIFNGFIIRNSYSEKLAMLAMASNSGLVDRSYGLSNNLFDSFGFITSILISITFIFSSEIKSNLLKAFSLILIIMPLVNARTGLILAMIGIIVAGFFYNDLRTSLRNIVVIIIAVVLFVLLLNQLPESMLKWLSNGLQETKALFSGSEKTGAYSKIFGSDFVFPSSVILGEGGLPKYFDKPGVDNGYINLIWNFGIVGTVFLILGYINLFRIAITSTNIKMYKAITTVIACIFFLYLFKVYSIDNFGGIVLVFGVTSMIIAQSSNAFKPAVIAPVEEKADEEVIYVYDTEITSIDDYLTESPEKYSGDGSPEGEEE